MIIITIHHNVDQIDWVGFWLQINRAMFFDRKMELDMMVGVGGELRLEEERLMEDFAFIMLFLLWFACFLYYIYTLISGIHIERNLFTAERS